MGLCSCLASCLAWGVQHWSLLAVGWSWVVWLIQRSLGELSPIDIMWGRGVSAGPISLTWLSHLGGSDLTPGQSTKTLSATWLRRNTKNYSKMNIKIRNKSVADSKPQVYSCSQSPPPQFWDDSLSAQVFHRCRVHQVDCRDLIPCS